MPAACKTTVFCRQPVCFVPFPVDQYNALPYTMVEN